MGWWWFTTSFIVVYWWIHGIHGDHGILMVYCGLFKVNGIEGNAWLVCCLQWLPKHIQRDSTFICHSSGVDLPMNWDLSRNVLIVVTDQSMEIAFFAKFIQPWESNESFYPPVIIHNHSGLKWVIGILNRKRDWPVNTDSDHMGWTKHVT